MLDRLGQRKRLHQDSGEGPGFLSKALISLLTCLCITLLGCWGKQVWAMSVQREARGWGASWDCSVLCSFSSAVPVLQCLNKRAESAEVPRAEMRSVLPALDFTLTLKPGEWKY